MFIALEVMEQKKRSLVPAVLHKLAIGRGKPRMWLEQRSCCGKQYAALRCEGNRPIDWEAVERVCGTYGKRLLLPEGLTPPEDSRLPAPAFPQFRARMIAHTACEVVARTRMPMYRRTVGFVDIRGNYPGLLRQLLKFYTSAVVVTGERAYYETVRQELMDTLGAPVVIGSGFESLADCVLVVSPDDMYTSQSLPSGCPVMTGGSLVAQGRFDRISGLRYVPAAEIGDTCPAGIDTALFAAALCEFSGMDFPTYFAQEMLYNYKSATIDEVARIIAHCAGVDTPEQRDCSRQV
ncbi:hypothetical protein LJC63_07510 [Ruminococcaceae bacterium OttesenSCG-928-L11]|nr:hypothetical protein [Ruminococcaceae bacterium OttesenSCG-928-L11]